MQLLLEASNRPAPRAGAVAGADACAAALLDALPSVMWFIRQQMRSRRTKGMSVPQFRTLILLRRYPSASVSAVSENLGSSLPTASRIVAGLVNKGLVTRKSRKDDRRHVSLELTARGRAALEAGLEGTRSTLAEKLGGLGAADCATVGRAMAVLADIFGSDSSAADVRGGV